MVDVIAGDAGRPKQGARPASNRSGHKGSKLINAGGEVTRYREPHRLRFRGKVEEHREVPAPVPAPAIDFEPYEVPVRAVLFAAAAPRATCRYVLGQDMGDFTYCGDRATVVVAGALTYCAHCAKVMGWDRVAWQRAQDAMRGHNEGMP